LIIKKGMKMKKKKTLVTLGLSAAILAFGALISPSTTMSAPEQCLLNPSLPEWGGCAAVNAGSSGGSTVPVGGGKVVAIALRATL
jgi:hypothetical protein